MEVLDLKKDLLHYINNADERLLKMVKYPVSCNYTEPHTDKPKTNINEKIVHLGQFII